MSKLRATLDNILFVFEDELAIAQGVKQFREKTNWGFDLLSSFDRSVKSAKWGIVISVGPLVSSSVTEGMRILIEPLKWTDGMKFEGNIFWATKEANILLVDDDY